MRDQQLRKACFCWSKKCCLFSCNFPKRTIIAIVVAGGKPTRRCDSTWSGWSPEHSDNGGCGNKQEMRSTDKIFLRFSDLGCGFWNHVGEFCCDGFAPQVSLWDLHLTNMCSRLEVGFRGLDPCRLFALGAANRCTVISCNVYSQHIYLKSLIFAVSKQCA